jgi:methylmalonyl-CoA mutase
MITSVQAEQLLSEFPEHSYEQWHAAAEALLKGAPFEKLLVTKTYEDVTIQPIYRREDIAELQHCKHFPGRDSLVRGSHLEGFIQTGWEVSQELSASDVSDLNAQIHQGLQGGQSELNIVLGCGMKQGVSLDTIDDISLALGGVIMDAVSIYWQSGPASLPIAALTFAAAENAGVSVAALRGGFENDPLGELVSSGSLPYSLETRFDHMAALTDYASKHATRLRTITAKGDFYHNAGASATQELGYVIASVVCYIEEMKTRGIPPERVMPHIRISLAVGSDYFMEIAKIRAARWLWSKIATAYGVEAAPVHIHANTSKWNKTTYDAHTNMLRVTSEAFSAVVGGVDSLHIGPFDEISGHTDDFSRRIARNIHTILREECGLDHVIDPAGGSTYIEWLTDQIASKSWKIFQNIESQGGMLNSLKNGSIQQAVTSVCEAKFQNIRRRKDKIVGSNIYPDLKGKKLEIRVLDDRPAQSSSYSTPPITTSIQISADASMLEQAISAAKSGANKISIAMATILTRGEDTLRVTRLPNRRAAEEYEALRDASAAFAIKTGAAPAILQLNIGPSGRYRLRADWTASFFEAAGFVIDGSRDFPSPEDAVKAIIASPALIAVITSDDGTYQSIVEPLAAAVKAAKPDIRLLVAGAPGESEAAWRASGVDDFVNVRSNNYELNEQLLKKAGVL